MNTFNVRINCCTYKNIKAKNIQGAICEAVKNYADSMPGFSNNIASLDILAKIIKEK